MTTKNDLIFFGEDWGGHPSTAQFIAGKLMDRGYRVLWVDSLGLRQPSFCFGDIKRIGAKLKAVLGKKKRQSRSQASFILFRWLSLCTNSPLLEK